MKVLLKVDIKKLGRKGDIVEVSDGYATSALIPTGKAEVATPTAIKLSAQNIAHKQDDLKKSEKNAYDLAARIKGQTVHIACKADGTKLFGSITATQVAQAIKTEYTIHIAEKNIILQHHIKEIGETIVSADLGFGAKAQFTVKVTAL